MSHLYKSTSGNIGLSGAASRGIITSRANSGTLALYGGVSRLLAFHKAPGGLLQISGSTIRHIMRNKGYSGTLSLSSSLTAYISRKALFGNLSTSGGVVFSVSHSKALSGQLSLSSTIIKSVVSVHAISSSGVVTLSGFVARKVIASKALSGLVTMSGSCISTKHIPKSLDGLLSFSGDTIRWLGRGKLVGGNLQVDGSVSAYVSISHFSKYISGRLDVSGGVAEVSHHVVPVGGALYLRGGTQTLLDLHRYVDGTLILSGGLFGADTNVVKTFGVLNLDSSLSFDIGNFPFGELSLSGMITTNVSKSVEGNLNLDGNLDIFVPIKAVEGELTLDGVLTKNISKNLDGNVGISGGISEAEKELQGYLYFNRFLAVPGTVSPGVLMLTGELSKEITKALSGTLNISGGIFDGRLSGLLSLSGTLDAFAIYPWATLDGTVSLSGNLTTNIIYAKALMGRVNFMKILTTSPYHNEGEVSLLNLSATKDLLVEQGESFRRYFRWMKSDGIPYNLSKFALKMVIRSTKDAPSVLASSSTNIAITRSGEAGLFQVDIPKSVTSEFDFIRAVYSIEASWGTFSARLVEGNVVLSKSASLERVL